MAQAYCHFLAPRRPDQRPHPQKVVALMQRLIERGFWCAEHPARMEFRTPAFQQPEELPIEIPVVRFRTGAARRVTERSDLHLAAAVEAVYERRPRLWTLAQQVFFPQLPAARPLLPSAAAPRTYGELGVAFSHDYSWPRGDNLRFDAPAACRACGAPFAGADAPYVKIHFGGRRVPRACPACRAALDPAGWAAAHRHPISGAPLEPLEGGGCFRFALVFDAGPDLPAFAAYPSLIEAAQPGFVAECEALLGVALHEFGVIR